MKCSLVAAGLVAVVAAQNPSAISKISVLASQLNSALTPPPSIVPELISIVPGSVVSALQNPSAFPALASALTASPPAWFTSLPADAKSWLVGAEGAYASIEPQLISLQAVATASGITAPGSVAGTGVSSSIIVAMSTSYANSTVTSVKSSTSGSASTKATGLTTSSSAVVASSSKAASSSSSSGGAASPTGAVAAGVMGAVGILGLALAL